MSEQRSLHLVCRSSRSSRALETCLRYCQPGDTLLFIQGGVASMPWVSPGEFEKRGVAVHWLEADVLARGLLNLAGNESWQIIDDDGFVGLVEQHVPIHTWT